MRVCFVGDSFVNGTGDDECLGWTGRVCAAARRSGLDLTCYNLGIRRDTSADVLARWRREAEARLPPDQDGRLVFSFGANDCVADADRSPPRIAPERALANAEVILAAAKAWRPTLMVGPLPACGDPLADERIAALSRAFVQLCARLGVPYLEVFPLAAASPVWTREAAAGDGTHPNAGGYAIIAAAVEVWPAWQAYIDA